MTQITTLEQAAIHIALHGQRISAIEADRAEFKAEIRKAFDTVDAKLDDADKKLDKLIAKDNRNDGAVKAALVLIGTGVLSVGVAVWRFLENLG
jgi:hypothetical protein